MSIEYIISRRAADWWEIARFSDSDIPDALYSIRERNGKFHCSCPSAFRTGGISCKHIALLKEKLREHKYTIIARSIDDLERAGSGRVPVV